MLDFKNSSIELLKKLPKCKGDLFSNISLANYSRFKTGGNAEILFIPFDEQDLQNFIKNMGCDIPITIIGLGSNILIRDGGIGGITILLANLKNIQVNDATGIITCGAFANSLVVAQMAKKHLLGGLEFLYCIPGTIGGGVMMNAGCYDRDYSNILLSVKTINRAGEIKNLSSENCKLEYRKSGIDKNEVVVAASFKGNISNNLSVEIIEHLMNKMMSKKEATQPVWERCAGSAFKNPEGKFAWQLIKETGSNLLTKGDAKISDKHSNFLINSGNASSSDIEDLGETIRRTVYEQTGIMLHWEIKILGDR